jgi:hypothetical protein
MWLSQFPRSLWDLQDLTLEAGTAPASLETGHGGGNENKENWVKTTGKAVRYLGLLTKSMPLGA